MSYEPGPIFGNNTEELKRYLDTELNVIAGLFSEFEADSIRFNKHTSEPDKPREGHLYYADGVFWNPGGGKGLYLYNGSAWGLVSSVSDSDWTTPSLTNSWVSFDGISNTAGYIKDSSGFVHLKGKLKSGTINGTAEMFTLPEGYRPGNRELLPAVSSLNDFIDTDTTPTRIEIDTVGKVIPMTGVNGWFSLDGIIFKSVDVGKIIKSPSKAFMRLISFAPNVSQV